MNGRDAILDAFDRLFDRAADKLHFEIDDDAKQEAKRQFEDRFAIPLKAARQLQLEEPPTEVIGEMEAALDRLSPAQIASHLASIPIVHQTQQIMQNVAYRAAEQRLVHHLIDQADETYGGN